MEMQIKTYNNKSRKGTYLQIKHKNTPTRLYKLTGQYGEADALKNYYEDRYLHKKTKGTQKEYQYHYRMGGTKKTNITPLKYINKLKKQGTLTSKLKKGIGKATITNITTATENQYTNAKKQILKKLVKDKQIIEIMTKNENFDKLKNRTEYHLTLKNAKKEKLLTATVHGKTINQIKQDIRKATINKRTRKEGTDPILQTLETRGWTGKTHEEGTIHEAELQIIMRRG